VALPSSKTNHTQEREKKVQRCEQNQFFIAIRKRAGGGSEARERLRGREGWESPKKSPRSHGAKRTKGKLSGSLGPKPFKELPGRGRKRDFKFFNGDSDYKLEHLKESVPIREEPSASLWDGKKRKGGMGEHLPLGAKSLT